MLPKRRGKSAAAGSELEQIAWSAPREVAKRCKCPAWSVATTAFDDRRFRGSVGMRNPDRHAAASVAYKLELWQIAHQRVASIDRSNIWAVENVLSPLVNFHGGSSHGGDENVASQNGKYRYRKLGPKRLCRSASFEMRRSTRSFPGTRPPPRKDPVRRESRVRHPPTVRSARAASIAFVPTSAISFSGMSRATSITPEGSVSLLM
jgi:hypothetical protein